MFDPFNDFETAGYLRNVEGLKDPEQIRRQEHFFFEVNLEEALNYLHGRQDEICYEDFLRVHRILFDPLYPWAGMDRHQLGVGRLITKGKRVQFELSEKCRQAIEWGLRLGNDVEHIRRRPGEVMGALAWGHPFLDGNGRTMLLVHSELCHRAGFAIDWLSSDKNLYLAALTHELECPADRVLDAYFSRLRIDSRPREDWVDYFKTVPGLSGTAEDAAHIGHGDDDIDALARYEAVRRSRHPPA